MYQVWNYSGEPWECEECGEIVEPGERHWCGEDVEDEADGLQDED